MYEAYDITSAANPRIKAAVKLRRSRDRRKRGLFLAEGPREVGRAVEAGLDVLEVYHVPTLIEASALGPALASGAMVFKVPDTILKLLAYREEPEGVVAVVRQPQWSLDGLPGADPAALYLVAVGTAKPGNLGAMVRTAAAAGCQAVLACGTAVDVFNPNAIRASTGAVYSLPVVSVTEAEALAYLKQQGVRIAATTPDAARSRCYTETDLTGALALVIGPEDTGLGAAWLDGADVCLSIPTRGVTVDSLNAANAAAVVLFEAVRQRTAGGD